MNFTTPEGWLPYAGVDGAKRAAVAFNTQCCRNRIATNRTPANIISLDISGCDIHTLPIDLFTICTQLQLLNFSRNRVREIPPEIARLSELETLHCSFNQLTTLPIELNQCPKLNMVIAVVNPFESIPPSLQHFKATQLPNCDSGVVDDVDVGDDGDVSDVSDVSDNIYEKCTAYTEEEFKWYDVICED
jgi:Leucine-rich repeat (LRR) protein